MQNRFERLLFQKRLYVMDTCSCNKRMLTGIAVAGMAERIRAAHHKADWTLLLASTGAAQQARASTTFRKLL